MYEERQPSFAQAAMAVAIWPPGSRVARWSRCLEFTAGCSATTASRSTLLRPNPATSKARSPACGIVSDNRTAHLYSTQIEVLSQSL